MAIGWSILCPAISQSTVPSTTLLDWIFHVILMLPTHCQGSYSKTVLWETAIMINPEILTYNIFIIEASILILLALESL